MIQLTDINGRTHAIHPDAIARLVEPGSSGKGHAAMEPTMQDALMKFDPETGSHE